MDPNDLMNAAASFILQSPPGEINDVLNDVRAIIADDESLKTGIAPAIEEYNLQQFTTVDVPGQNHKAIIHEIGKQSGSDDRFIDPRSKTTFVFDHITLQASDPEPFESSEEAEPFRAFLEESTLKYVYDHFNDAVCSVFADPNSTKKYFILIVANKYNAPNFWSGRWRSQYEVDLEQRRISGTVLINVHYYEQGNVQLQTTHNPTLLLPSSPSPTSQTASKILQLIESQESAYQSSLTNVYHDLGERTFKGLRRALPLTRQKLDWDKVC
ncbi:F-actin-capping protein subunit alpha [Tulasnella sp. 418]|nr:F-actin-capping protein subunit alpha [Tulasnella sp. 418]